MIHIIEGTDAVGKSSYAQWLLAAEGGQPDGILLHGEAPVNDNAYDEYVVPLLQAIQDGHTTIICDRWHIGELVWPRIFKRPSLFHVDDAWQEVNDVIGTCGLAVDVTVVWRSGEDIVRTLHERGEMNQARGVLRAQTYFVQLAQEQGLTLVQSKDLPPFNTVDYPATNHRNPIFKEDL